MSSLRKLKAAMKYTIDKKINKIMSNDKDVKKPTKDELDAAKAVKEKIIKSNQTVKK